MQTKPFTRTASLVNTIESLGYRATEGDLVLSSGILGTSASYELQINDNGSTPRIAGEIRLRPGDAFIPTKVGLYLMKAGTSVTPTDAELAVAQLHTFPNPLVFTGASEAANLESVYRGYWTLNLNNVEVLKFLEIGRYRRVETAQQGTLIFTASNQGRSGWTGPDYGMHNLQNDVGFSGQDNQSIKITLPAAINNVGTTTANYIIMKFRGAYIFNAAKDMSDVSHRAFERFNKLGRA